MRHHLPTAAKGLQDALYKGSESGRSQPNLREVSSAFTAKEGSVPLKGNQESLSFLPLPLRLDFIKLISLAGQT